MAPVFLDTNVFLFAAGADHPLRDAAQALLAEVARGALGATTNAEVLQEILYVLDRRGLRQQGVALARSVARLVPEVLPVTRADMTRACDLVAEHPALPPRDAVHAATMLHNRITTVYSADAHFDLVPGIARRPLGEAAVRG